MDQQNRLTVVGIGASAGGLAAVEAFFSAMPSDAETGMAFVVVQHMAPDHKSLLSELIRRRTRMRVVDVEDGMAVQPDCAYIIPPNRDMAVLNGSLQLLEPAEPRGRRLPIDFFFRSLAQDQHERAIGIVLSGTGSDGTQGVRAIKGGGGMVMAQDPTTTEYDSMPRSAIATGMVDSVAAPEEMPAKLMAFVTQAFGKPPYLPGATSSHDGHTENALRKIHVLLRAHTGHDFSQYKQSTIHRRIERRIAVHQIEAIDDYVRYLQQTPLEVDSLFRDLLIGVTGFFRDREAFHAFEELVLSAVCAGKNNGSPIRLWVPGCSSGEEAYSLSMLLADYQARSNLNIPVQVFATDLDREAISTARAGVYPASIALEIDGERLARYFTAEDGGYRVRKEIRDMIVFSEQDVVKDPPFSKLDVVSCRNLLIYMGADLQRKLIPLFHYALRPGGYLFLGTSESIGDFADLFSVKDRKAKIYQSKPAVEGTPRPALGSLTPLPAAVENPGARLNSRTGAAPARGVKEIIEQGLLQHLAPSGVLVNGQGDILYLYGRTGRYLEPAEGDQPVGNILKMSREGLRRDLTTALMQAARKQEPVVRPNLRVKTNGGFSAVTLTVNPIPRGANALPLEALYLVILEEVQGQSPVAETPQPQAGQSVTGLSAEHCDDAGRVAALERELHDIQRELRDKEEYLQSANEELQTANEELKSSNEELQSVNEELQSSNEELETSKEELQSINEELATVNAELHAKVSDLSRVNNDMSNLLAGTGIGTVFVDHQLRILRFTPAVTRIINLIQADVGRPVNHILSNLKGYDHLQADVQLVLDTLIPKEMEVQTQGGDWYWMRILPYRTLENVIEGAVITFVEISPFRKEADLPGKNLH